MDDREVDIGKKVDINKAIKDFAVEYKTDQMKKVKETPKKSDYPKIVLFFVKHSGGLIKNEKYAEYIILIIVALAIIFSLNLFSKVNSPNKDAFKPAPPREFRP